jgi:hypothetical protein
VPCTHPDLIVTSNKATRRPGPVVNGATQEGRDVARDLIIFEPIEPHWRTGRTSVLPKLAFVDPAWALGLVHNYYLYFHSFIFSLLLCTFCSACSLFILSLVDLLFGSLRFSSIQFDWHVDFDSLELLTRHFSFKYEVETLDDGEGASE